MALHRVVLTYQDYLATPDDGRRYEILDGEIQVTAAPGMLHQLVLGNLYAVLHAHVTSRGLGRVFFAPLAVILADTTVVEPDLVYVSSARAAIMTERGIVGAPSLLVEALSGSTAARDRGQKLQLYARYAVPHYWIVEIERRAIEAYELTEGAYRLVTRASGRGAIPLPPFPDLQLVPDSLWL